MAACQRLRITFSKGEALRYISHLDLMRVWERAFRRAGIPLAYSGRFNPRPRISMASALPVSFTGQAEVMEVWLKRRMAPQAMMERLRPHLPCGLTIASVEEVGLRLPSLASRMRLAEYRVRVESEKPLEDMEARIRRLLAATSLPRRRKGREYDLRPLVDALRLEGKEEQAYIIWMRLQARPQATGRPEEVLDELGLGDEPYLVERTRLIWEKGP